LLGREAPEAFTAIPIDTERRLASRAFPASGHYLLQFGHATRADRISVLFDCGKLGFGSISAHGHADALSLTLRAFGQDILVDPGTFDYFSYPAWREYFRGTFAHNTVLVDGLDQSTLQGSFLWGQTATARCLQWHPSTDGGTVTGEHDGYVRLADPVTHRRTLRLAGRLRTLTVEDTLVAGGEHRVAILFHLSETCVARAAGGVVQIGVGSHVVRLELDPRLEVTILEGSEQPIGGWVSRGYHQKNRATTIVGTGSFRGSASFRCTVVLDPAL